MRQREFGGAGDLRAMQRAVQRGWAPGARWHVGDLAWQWSSTPGDAVTSLWGDGEQVSAWARLSPAGELDFFAEPGQLGPVLDWAGGARSVTVMDGDREALGVLADAGFRAGDGPFFEHCVRTLGADLPAPEWPDGYRVRPLRDSEAAARAAVHRAAWRPARIGELLVPPLDLGDGESRVSAEAYARVMRTWPYRPALDQVVEGPDGELVAFALGWLDGQNRAGLLEPVGVDPRHGRRGLGAAVSLACLAAMRAAGAERAVVCPRGDAGYPVPGRLYRGIGFRPVGRTVTLGRASL